MRGPCSVLYDLAMGFNDALADRLEQMARMLQLLDSDRFRVNAHDKAARVIREHPEDLRTLAHDPEALTRIEGIGAKTASKLAEFADSGDIAEHAQLRDRVPIGLLELFEIQGLGPKTIRQLWQELGVTGLDALKAALAQGDLDGLKGMGSKTIENIRNAIEHMESSQGRLHLGVAMPIAEAIVGRLCEITGVSRVAFAGSLRRGRETIGDIDVLAVAQDPARAHEALTDMDGVQRVLARGTKKSSVIIGIGREADRWGPVEDARRGVQVDLRVVPEASWGAALMYFTGSKDHNVKLRERAIKRGLTLNEYGLFEEDPDDSQSPPQDRGLDPTAGKTEQEVYAALGLPLIPPELREDRGELSLDRVPELIEVGDIRAELHAHTTASDGGLVLEDLVAQAASRGYHTIAITDHSRSSVQAGGLSPERLAEQIERVRLVDAEHPSIRVLAGSEVDIHADGSLDYHDDLLSELDIVVASPHAALTQDAGKATARLIRAIEHPAVRILGHPTGRLIARREGLSPALDEIIAAAREHDVALEINAHWMRLDLRDTHVRAVVEAGALIAINCDVHARTDFDNLRYGVLTARRGWLGPDSCVNTWDADRLCGWLARS